MENLKSNVKPLNDFEEIYESLSKIAYPRTIPFCYNCYIKAPKGKCAKCGSDDLMRLVEGVGVDWWYIVRDDAIDDLLSDLETFSEDSMEEEFINFLDECYPVFELGYGKYYASDILKNCSPGDYQLSLNEHLSESIMSSDHYNDEGQCYIQINDKYYRKDDVIDLIDEYDFDE